MKPIVLPGHYVLIDPDGDIMTHTITEHKQLAVSVHLADQTYSSVPSDAIKGGFQIVQADIVFTNIKKIEI